jgi:putative transposase
LHSQVLQNVVERVKKAYERYTNVNKSGKRSGKPRYKKVGRYRSFTYPQLKADRSQGNRINLPKIGSVKLILHRPIPEGFQLKTATLIKKAGSMSLLQVKGRCGSIKAQSLNVRR